MADRTASIDLASSKAEPVSRLHVFSLDRVEQGLARLFAYIRLLNGVALMSLLYWLVWVPILLFADPSTFYGTVATIILVPLWVVGIDFLLFKLNKTAAKIASTISWIGLGLSPLLGVLMLIIYFSNPVPFARLLVFAILFGVLFPVLFLAYATDWRFFSKLGMRDRALLRTPFRSFFSKRTLFEFTGIPFLFHFLREGRTEVFLLAALSSFCFGLAVNSAITFPITLLDVGLNGFLSIVVCWALIPVCFFAANRLTNRVRDRVRFSIEQLTKVDTRPPLLFLRSFRDDQVGLQRSRLTWLGRALSVGLRPQPLDEILVEEGTLYGPVVALGNPRDKIPPYGAARGYFDNKDWQEAVTDLAERAVAIIVCLDDTASLWWEVELIVTRAFLDKALFVVPPQLQQPAAKRELLNRLFGQLSATLWSGADRLAPEPVAALIGAGETIGLFVTAGGDVEMFQSTSFADLSYLGMVRGFLRSRLGLRRVQASLGKPAKTARPPTSRQTVVACPQCRTALTMSRGRFGPLRCDNCDFEFTADTRHALTPESRAQPAA